LKKADIVAALVLLGLSTLVVTETWDLPYWARFPPGPAFAAVWVAAAGFLIGAVLLVQALRSGSAEPVDWPDRTGARQVTLGAAAIWILLAMIPWLGTAVAGLIFMMFFLLAVARRPLLPSIFTSVFTVVMIETVFGVWLHIRLPQGVLGF
jgi:putative tricarboxylic transport membrane protein